MMLLQSNPLCTGLAILGIYFLWMDIGLFNALNNFNNSPKDKDSHHYSPLRPLTIKLLFQSPTNNYIDSPLSYATLYLTNIADHVSADAVSISSIFVAGLSSKLIGNIGSLKTRQMGVLLYKIRDYLDAVDGDVARHISKETRVIPNPSSRGYYFDGVCDGFGVIFLVAAVGYLIYQEQKKYFLKTESVYKFILNHVVVILLQILVSSIIWNYFMFKYHVLLETNSLVTDLPDVQKSAFGYTSFWIIIYLWRILNPHSLSQYILISVLFNKENVYWTFIRFNGFSILCIVTACSELYYQYLSFILLHK